MFGTKFVVTLSRLDHLVKPRALVYLTRLVR